MTTKQFSVMLVLVVIAGFLGGAVADLLLHGNPAAAELTGERPKVVKAQSFVLADEAGNTQAVLGLENGAPVLCLYDADGKRSAMLGLIKGSPSLYLYTPGANQAIIVNPRGLISEANPQPSP